MRKTINELCQEIHEDNVKAGWWTDPKTGQSIKETRNVPEMLMLIVSEVSEAMEGCRAQSSHETPSDTAEPHRARPRAGQHNGYREIRR